jgi:lipocalin
MSKDTASKVAMGRPLLAVLCPIILALAACIGRPAGVEPVSGFDILHYQGTWYEIMRFLRTRPDQCHGEPILCGTMGQLTS